MQEDSQVEQPPQMADGQFAFSTCEPVRLDTGTEYVKLPLGSYVKILSKKDDKYEVERIGNFGAKMKHGYVACEHLQPTPGKFIPAFVQLADRLTGKTINLSQNVIDLDQAYFDVGPKSKSFKNDESLRVREVLQEFASVNLMDTDGNTIAFGKIRTCSFSDAKLVAESSPHPP